MKGYGFRGISCVFVSRLLSGLLILGSLLFGINESATAADFELKPGVLLIKHDRFALPVSLNCPEFIVDGKALGAGVPPSSVKGDIRKSTVEVTYPPIACAGAAQLEVKLFLEWSPKESILRKWASYRLMGEAKGNPLLTEIMLEKLDNTGRPVRMNPWRDQSYPVFMDGFFCGIEFPVASTRQEGATVILGHQPGLRLKAGPWHDSRKAVFGTAPAGEETREFKRYITAHHSRTKGVHLDYNSWWTSSAPYYTEAELVGLARTFEEKLYKPYGVGFDTFTIDMGWSNPQSIWEIDRKLFPQEFTNLQRAAEKMKTHLGLWISPSASYPTALDQNWAKSQGYETFDYPTWWPGRFLCLAGERYRGQFEARMLDVIKRFGVRQFKLDGCMFQCNAADHGHEPGPLSAEAVAEGVMKTYAAVHKAYPDVWLQTCSWGSNPSPWWLFEVDSVIASYGDDIVFGRVPSPVYRESHTSSRDFYNLQAAAISPVPIAFQEHHGFNHQTDEDFMNDAVVQTMRGSMFLAHYINPACMTDLRWRNLAVVLKWARKNAPILEETDPLLPATWLKKGVPPFTHEGVMPHDPYGYVHWKDSQGLVVIRNPWIMPTSYALKLDRAAGTPAGVKELSVVSLYPEIRLYGQGLGFGNTINVPLAPYETVLLSLKKGQSLRQVPPVAERIGGRIRVLSTSHELKRIELKGKESLGGQSAKALGRNPTRVMRSSRAKASMRLPRRRRYRGRAAWARTHS